jgi:penicillin-binding protein 1A
VGIQEVQDGGRPLPDGSRRDTNMVETKRVLPPEIAETETSVLETVLQYGTAKAAALGEFAAGKTGTTSNYGDAWFVGWNHKYTVAVWVGYPNKLVPMLTDFNGGPVLGGTFPALIWHDFMVSALGIEKERAEHAAHPKGLAGASGSGAGTSSTGEVETGAPSSTGATRTPSQGAPATTGAGAGTGAGREGGKSATPGGTGGGNESSPTQPGNPKASGEPEHTAAPTPATPTPEAPSAPSSPTPSTPATPSSPSPTGGVSPGG